MALRKSSRFLYLPSDRLLPNSSSPPARHRRSSRSSRRRVFCVERRGATSNRRAGGDFFHIGLGFLIYLGVVLGGDHFRVGFAVEMDEGLSWSPIGLFAKCQGHRYSDLVQEMDQTLRAEAGGSSADQLPDLRLRNSQNLAGFDLSEFAV